MLCDPRHPAFKEFPNDGWSDWQWHDLCAGATTFNLTGAPPGFRPIVQLVPDFHFNTLLGQVFEARVGGGSLLVCGYDLTRHLDARPAARQFRRSLFRYLGSPSFRPSTELPPTWIETHFRSAGLALEGITCLPRQDQSNGRVARADLFLSRRADEWGSPVTELQGNDTAELITLRFPQPVNARFLRLVARSEVHGQSFAALAELGLITNAWFPETATHLVPPPGSSNARD